MKLIRKEFVFDDPTPTPQCHASTIVKTGNNRFIAAWFAGEEEKANDVKIWVSCFANGCWSAPKVVSTDLNIPHWNPVLFQTDETTVYLFYKVGYEIPDWYTKFIISKDAGCTWSEPKELVAGDTGGGRGPVKNKAIRISNGSILAPASTEQGCWRPFIDIWDGSDSWEKAIIPTDVNLIQPTLWESAEGQIHALLRSDCGRIYRSDSSDYGRTWSEAYPTDMPNNNSGIDCTKLEDGRVVLVCNPISENWGSRSPLSVYVSADNGMTFRKELDLETEQGEFSYPGIIHDDSRIYIIYTWNRRKIRFCELEV